MSAAARKLLLGIALILGAGAAIGWLYNAPLIGLLIAALLILAWQVRHLVKLEQATRSGKFDELGYGDGLWEQISSRIQFERARSERRKREYRTLLKELRKSTNALPDGAVVLDAHNEIVTSNRAAKSLIGLKRKKDRGQRIDNILRDPEIARLMGDHNSGESIDIPSPLTDGCWLRCRVVPYGANQKLLLARDVTEQLRLGKMRRDFVANASHELRSPLTVINGYLDTIAEDPELPDAWSKPVRQMRIQAQRMNRLLGEMLELSRLESAGAAKAESIDIAALLARVCDEYKGFVSAAEVVQNIECTGRLLGVEREIESVVTNLLTNAIRYTPVDGEITVSWRPAGEGAELLVTDTGDGIDADLVPRLTERFFRVERGRSREDGGIGLGLAIVKHVLARHDAELIISSVPGEGSEFCCRFPADRIVGVAPSKL